MGWKTCSIWVDETCGKVPLALVQPHDPEKARWILKKLYLGRSVLLRSSTISDEMYVQDGEIAIGAYRNAVFISELAGYDRLVSLAHYDKFYHSFEFEFLRFTKKAFPKSNMFLLELLSTTDLAAFAWLEDGKIVRRYIADHWRGGYLSEGTPLEEEIPYLSNCPPDKVFDIGEELAFAILSKFFGRKFAYCPPGELDTSELLEVEVFKKKSLLYKLMGDWTKHLLE